MRVLLLFMALLLSSLVAPAQTLPAAHPADLLALQSLPAAPPDSAAALRRLFASKRKLRPAVVLSTALVGGLSLLAGGVFGSDKTGSSSQLAFQSRVFGITLVAGAGELLYYRHYSREKEQVALAALARRQLSPELKYRLKPRYFQASALAPASASPVPATVLPAAPPVATPVAAVSPAVDTAAALHRLFARRRHNGHVGLGTGAGLLAASGIALAIGTQGGYRGLGVSLAGSLGAVASVPFLTRGLILTVAHSNRREQRILQAWQQHRLPKRWARRALIPPYTQLQQ